MNQSPGPFQSRRRVLLFPGLRTFLGLLLSLLGAAPLGLDAAILWREDFESLVDVVDRWSVEGGVWAIGKPTSGPAKSHGGTNCAATVLNGNYLASRDSRLVRDQSFVIPEASEYPRLRFWHWNNNFAEDPAQVEIQVGAGAWEPLSRQYIWNSTVWTRATLDLRKYAGLRVRIGFRFRANGDAKVATGWYVDDVELVSGKPQFNIVNNPDGFVDLGDWNVEAGDWEVGVPVAGPGKAFEGTTCAGTVLAANYDASIDTRLISPEFQLPPTGDFPRLKFWHWNANYGEDPGTVEIRADGGEWITVSRPVVWFSRVWTQTTLDLRAFGDRTVEIAFHFKADSNGNAAAGWYIDNVEIATGEPVIRNPEGFESGLGDWSVEGGAWQVGAPTRGPGVAASGAGCAGTILAGNYEPRIDAQLISPEFTVPDATQYPRLRFSTWHSFGTGDHGVVEIRKAGESVWQTVSPTNSRASSVWTRPSIDLRTYAGKRVQVGFRLFADADASVGTGWYVDDVELVVGEPGFDPVGRVHDFEQGLQDWHVDRGDWQVGVPRFGPTRAVSGTACAGTVLGGNYDVGMDSRLISPPFLVPASDACPELRFWSWHSLAAGDSALVELRVVGSEDWRSLSAGIAGDNRAWTRSSFPLQEFAGQSVELAFHLRAGTDAAVGPGWYVDDVSVATGCRAFALVNHAEGFESGLEDWDVEGGSWTAGAPKAPGPSRAFLGTQCAGTGMAGNYDPRVNARLVSPPFLVPCADSSPRLRWAHWHSFGTGDSGFIEVQEEGMAEPAVLAGPFTGTSGDWIPSESADLSAFAGRRVRVLFRLSANTDGSVGPGWFVDHVRILAQVLDPGGEYRLNEGETLTLRVSPVCPDLKLITGPETPAGVQLDPDLGLLNWITAECDGPGVHQVTIRAVDPRDERVVLQAITNFVTVAEINAPPQFGTAGPLGIAAGFPLEFQARDYVYDPDCPEGGFTFTLDAAPAGAVMDAGTGRLTWIPSLEQAGLTNRFVIRVTDGGVPAFSATTEVLAHEILQFVEIRHDGDRLLFGVSGGSPGQTYEIESATTMEGGGPGAASWSAIGRIVWPNAARYSGELPLGTNAQQFLRWARPNR